MIEVRIDPLFEILHLTEVHDEAIRIGFIAGKGQRDRPVVPMYEGTVAIVLVLTVGERDIAVGFFASEHSVEK